MRSIILQIVMFACIPLFVQWSVSQNQPVADSETKKIIDGIKAGDVNALGVAAAAGNQIFVPYLKEQLRNPKAKLHKETSGLQVGLAKAGETQQLQQISCELNFGDATTRYDAISKVQSVAGWFAISNMAEFLRDVSKYRARFGEGLGPMQNYALQYLPELVPAPPLPPPRHSEWTPRR